ncbi:MAG TPA: hypothetical protein VMN38_02040 [Sphingomicrobium sp.]|nr:hypothetical protein [Sphingomicrobium sp.]
MVGELWFGPELRYDDKRDKSGNSQNQNRPQQRFSPSDARSSAEPALGPAIRGGAALAVLWQLSDLRRLFGEAFEEKPARFRRRAEHRSNPERNALVALANAVRRELKANRFEADQARRADFQSSRSACRKIEIIDFVDGRGCHGC